MLTKNETLSLWCEALGAGLEGICRHAGQVVFVPGVLPGETARVRIIKVAKRHAVGKLLSLDAQTLSPSRQDPPCPYYPRCGGCAAQHMAYEQTLSAKRRQVGDCLARIGGAGGVLPLPALGMVHPFRYRNKGAFPVGGTPGAPVLGLYAQRSHRIVDTPEGCLLQSSESDALVRAVRRWMERYAIAPYNEETHTGLVRHVMTRQAKDGRMMLVLVVHNGDVPHAQALVAGVREEAPAVSSIMLSRNTRRTNVILGDAFETLWGADHLMDEIAGFSMRVSPRTFFQVNRAQAERLCETAAAYAGLTGAETVWDLYCGCGTLTLPLSRHAKHVVGVEVVEDAVRDARANAQANGVSNAAFLAGAAEAVLPGLMREKGRPDVVVLDPPRKGAEPDALAAIVEAAPRRIVYVSCNPATLARDAGVLLAAGYGLERVQPVDMFAWTAHVETVCLMSRMKD